jgi:hypothetical protein
VEIVSCKEDKVEKQKGQTAFFQKSDQRLLQTSSSASYRKVGTEQKSQGNGGQVTL